MKRMAIALTGALILSPMVSAAEDWSGVYFGINANSLSADVSVDLDPNAAIWGQENLFAFSDRKSAWAGDVTVGYKNNRLGFVVLGAEGQGMFGSSADLSFSEGRDLFPDFPGVLTTQTDVVLSVKPKGRLVGTIEIPFGDILVGVDGGVAAAKLSMNSRLLGPENSFTGVRELWLTCTASETKMAFTHGVRATYAVNKNVWVNARFDWTDYSTECPSELHELVIYDKQIGSGTTKVNAKILRVGVSYRF